MPTWSLMFRCKSGAPLFDELRPIDYLVALRSLTSIGPVRGALEMRDYGRWLVHHLPATVTNLEGEICVVVVDRRIPLVEPANLHPQRPSDHQASRRDVVDLAYIV